ncbi:CHAT domain-containing protein [Cryptosporangium sp. NPDC051539]|uniref:CHAT domain-containing protein n=1 Tax=Cryptosporangium sp. NPDC051539 TaxID=3363962 RepID=UPI003799745D
MTTISEPVRRVLARDDLLMMAIDADEAVGIVRQREALSRLSRDEKSLFSTALEHHLSVAEGAGGRAGKAQAWRYAGVIVRFCELVGIPVEQPGGKDYRSEELHANSLDELRDPVDHKAPPRDLTLYFFNLYATARDLRLGGDLKGARRRAWVSAHALLASGAEPELAHLMFEVGAAVIGAGQAVQVERLLKELDRYWTTTRAAHYSTRYRFDLIRAIARWEAGHPDAAKGLDEAISLVGQGPEALRSADPGLEKLSMVLTEAEFRAQRATSPEEQREAARLGHEALKIAEDVRGRWRVVARSRAPLAVVFHRIYGDIALLAASLPVPEAARLGLRVSLSAKQTGFAARMRSGRQLMSSTIEGIIESIIDLEDSDNPDGVGSRLDELRFELAEAVSPMLADTVIPLPTDLSTVTSRIGSRHALDYQELPDSLAGAPNLFRTLIRPDSRITFERFHPDAFHATLFERARTEENLATVMRGRDLRPTGQGVGDLDRFDWLTLGESILPAELRDDLRSAPDPVELLISAHSWLCLVPWPALEFTGEHGRRLRLVERANVTQTPVFTCLQHERPAPVTGRAMIRLVGQNEYGVDVTEERAAWGLEASTDGVPLSECAIRGSDRPEPLTGKLTDARGDWGFVHIAAHGDGRGLEQHLRIPNDSVSFAGALGLHWPGSVLMASCHVGQVINEASAEPLNLVMALLTGGARCVVAGITSVDDQGTGALAGRLVSAIRSSGVALDVALHQAQRAAAAAGAPEREWALLAAYTQ